MTPQELAETTDDAVQGPGGSEGLLAQMMVVHGVIVAARQGAFYPKEPEEGASNWENVEVRHLWCDRSVWEMPWGTKMLKEEIDEAKKAGKHVRDVVFARLVGGNHFVSTIRCSLAWVIVDGRRIIGPLGYARQDTEGILDG